MEPLSELNALLGPSDPLATTIAGCDEKFCNPIPDFTAPLPDHLPTGHKHCTGSDFSDFDLEQLLCPFTANDHDFNCFDLESLIDS